MAHMALSRDFAIGFATPGLGSAHNAARKIADVDVDSVLSKLRNEIGDQALSELLKPACLRFAYPGETLVHAGQSQRAGILILGLLRTVVTYCGGETATIQYMRAHELYGVPSLFHPTSMNVEVLKTAAVIELDGPTVVRVAAGYPAFSWFLAREAAKAAARVPAIVEEFAFKTVRQRVAGHLIDLSERESLSGELVAHVTQQVLADSVGSAREVVARCLQSLKEDGLVTVARRAVYITNASRLAFEASGLGCGARGEGKAAGAISAPSPNAADAVLKTKTATINSVHHNAVGFGATGSA